MTDIVSPLLQWLNAHPEFAGFATFIISAAESVAIIGTIVPGSIMMTALGTLAGAGVIPLWPTIFWAIMGAIVGDGISYWIGHYFKGRLPKVWPFRNHPGLLFTGEKFVLKYGAMSVFIGRFVGPVRALVPLVAGMLGMRPLTFTIANVLSAILWAPAYMLPGIVLGAASLELPPDIAIHVMLVLLLIGLFILLCLWFMYKLLQLIQVQTDQAQTSIWQVLKNNKHLRPITVLIQHYDPKKPHGQLNLAFYFLFAGALFLGLIVLVKMYGAGNIMVNDAMFHLFRGIRNPSADGVMLYVTLLGQKEVILPVLVVIFAWLLYNKRWRMAAHAVTLGVLAAGSVFVMKHLIRSPRPWGILQSPETYSMPSGHSTLAICIYLGLAFLIAISVRPRYRWPIYTVGFLLTLAIGISRMYLGAHWFTDVLAAWLLGAAILMFVIISYLRKKEKPIAPLGLILVSIITLACTLNLYHYRHSNQLKMQYSQVGWPTVSIDMGEWWETNGQLPAYQASLFGFPSQNINIEWVGNLEEIRTTLLKQGWSKPPARDWVSTLHRIADVKSSQYLSLISPQYLDKRPALILARRAIGEKNLLVLRLWDANRTLNADNKKLWVGIVGTVPRSYSWLVKSHPGQILIEPDLVFPNKMDLNMWEWKLLEIKLPHKTYEPSTQTIMLIRENKSIDRK